MKAQRRYFDPLAIGAPRPLLELPLRLERMIHFVPPHNEKVRAKAAELAGQVDVILGNLEDAIPIDAKEAARDGLIAMAKATDFAQGNIRHALEPIRRASRRRPVVLAVTCLNEAIPRQPHPEPYPFWELANGDAATPTPEHVPEPLRRCIDEHRRAFDGQFDAVVPIDLTREIDAERRDVEQLLGEVREVTSWLEQREQAASIVNLYGR